MDDLDSAAWNTADWTGVVAHHPNDGHVDGRARHRSASSRSSGEWTCVVGEFKNGDRMVTFAKDRDGANR